MEPYYIAELGTCHNHDEKATKSLIRELRECGVDAIKFQYWSDSARLAEQRKRPALTKDYERWRTDLKFIECIYPHAKWVEQAVSVFLPEDCQSVEPFTDIYKIASLESRNLELIYAADKASNGRELIISTGCSGPDDFKFYRSLQQNTIAPSLHCPVQLLHCITSYPANIEDLNLRVIQNYRLDGYSDHSGHMLAGAAAVMHGARYLEFHVRHDRTPKDCPDYPHSLTASQVQQYIQNCRDVIKMRGEFLRKELESESVYRSMRS